MSDRPIYTEVVGARKNDLGTVARGALGYAVFGVFGAAVGVTSARKVVFRITYSSGKVRTETVRVNSARYRELVSWLK